jgi:uncharacterized membrane protein
MHKVLVSVFDSEKQAFEGLSALKELHQSGDISLYASAVVAKLDDGRISIKQEADSGPIGTLAGAVTGSLVGILGGPAGVALGAYVGGFGGLLVDMFNEGVSFDFIDEVGADLTPGKTAIVADMDEMWIVPVETRLGSLGAKTFRRYADDIVDEQLTREADETKADMTQLHAELQEASAEAKAKVQARIDADERKLQELGARLDAQSDKQTATFKEQMAKLQAQLKAAQQDRKAEIEARMAERKASSEKRQAKLAHARALTREAAQLTKEAVLA